ncbi:hypothetical protein FNF29_02514 [Cafeteria roenbergensis]|uniref:WD repeat-containing protein 75 second beta-propeller domain-containing protein n=1 Tax=Cafeteria roenbergensis TaxID=33653 RepID=A0A5A8C782_CAFRO|nr:hypothetical protein FNF31_07305 [Cafeteria roenbergensis]KAA0154294.1 hypothetical protein FNF29_02514 [Cafeteria roenbergensis]|eukprot:KAA0154294.1 hypothetical protein FNF29_02514 [Cafeteria roenbergensis]
MAAVVVGGADPSVRPPCFTNDRQTVLVCYGPDVRGFSAASGQPKLTFRGHAAAVTAVVLHPGRPEIALTSSLDGTVRAWDVASTACLRVWTVGSPITHLCVPEDADSAVACLLEERGMSGSEAYVPGRELLTVQVPRAVRDMPSVRVVELRLPGLASLSKPAPGALAEEADSLPAAVTQLTRAMRGVCAGMAGRRRPRSATVGGASAGSPGAVVAWAVRKSLFVWDTARRRLHRHGLPRFATALCVSPTAPDDIGDVGAFAAPVVTVGDVEGQLVDVHCLSEGVLERLEGQAPSSGIGPDVDADEDDDAGAAAASSLAPEGSAAQAASNRGKSVVGAAAAAPSSSRHWHAHAVAACARTCDGSALLSGGEEATMVRWDAGTGASSRNFLPRVGAPIRSLAESAPMAGAPPAAVSLPPLVAMGLADCSLVVVDAASLRILWRARGLALAGAPSPSASLSLSSGRHLRGGLAVDPRTGCVAVNGFPGRPSLQLFDARRGRHAAEVQVSSRNWISRADGPPPPELRVTHAAFSPDGRGLVTAECSTAPELRSKPCLRFWTWSAARRRFVLSTKVAEAHRGDISVLLHHPAAHAAVSAASARTFKVWQRRRRAAQRAGPARTAPRRKGAASDKAAIAAAEAAAAEPVYSWSCRSVGFWRDEPISAGAWSGDGSLLALAYGSTVTLWQPLANTLRATLSKTAPNRPYLHLAIPPGGTALAAATATEVQCWDLVAGALAWTVQGVSARCLTPEPASAGIGGTRFAAVLSATDGSEDGEWAAAASTPVVAVWDPIAARPQHVWRFAEAEQSAEPAARVEAVVFLPPSSQQATRGSSAGRSVSVGSEDFHSLTAEQAEPKAELAALTADNNLVLLSTGPATAADPSKQPAAPFNLHLAGAAGIAGAPDRLLRDAPASALALGQVVKSAAKDASASGSAAAAAAAAAATLASTGLRLGRADAVIAGPVHTLPPPSEFAAAAITAMLPAPAAAAPLEAGASSLSAPQSLTAALSAGAGPSRSVSASPPFFGRFGSLGDSFPGTAGDSLSLALPPAFVAASASGNAGSTSSPALRGTSSSTPSAAASQAHRRGRNRRASSSASSRGTAVTGVAPADALAMALLTGARGSDDEDEDDADGDADAEDASAADAAPADGDVEPDVGTALAASLGASLGARASAAVSGGVYLALSEANRDDAGSAWGLRLGVAGRGRSGASGLALGRSASRGSFGSEADAREDDGDGILADGARQAALRQFVKAGASIGLAYLPGFKPVASRKRARSETEAPADMEQAPTPPPSKAKAKAAVVPSPAVATPSPKAVTPASKKPRSLAATPAAPASGSASSGARGKKRATRRNRK